MLNPIQEIKINADAVATLSNFQGELQFVHEERPYIIELLRDIESLELYLEIIENTNSLSLPNSALGHRVMLHEDGTLNFAHQGTYVVEYYFNGTEDIDESSASKILADRQPDTSLVLAAVSFVNSFDLASLSLGAKSLEVSDDRKVDLIIARIKRVHASINGQIDPVSQIHLILDDLSPQVLSSLKENEFFAKPESVELVFGYLLANLGEDYESRCRSFCLFCRHLPFIELGCIFSRSVPPDQRVDSHLATTFLRDELSQLPEDLNSRRSAAVAFGISRLEFKVAQALGEALLVWNQWIERLSESTIDDYDTEDGSTVRRAKVIQDPLGILISTLERDSGYSIPPSIEARIRLALDSNGLDGGTRSLKEEYAASRARLDTLLISILSGEDEYDGNASAMSFVERQDLVAKFRAELEDLP